VANNIAAASGNKRHVCKAYYFNVEPSQHVDYLLTLTLTPEEIYKSILVMIKKIILII